MENSLSKSAGEWAESVVHNLEELRRRQPLVYAITNFVTMNDVANSLLATGGSPVMAQASEEVPEIVQASQAILLNLGTLTAERLQLMTASLEQAEMYQKPVVLDPVGAGGTAFRTEAAQRLLKSGAVKMVRANMSEGAALLGVKSSAFTRGVDSVSQEMPSEKAGDEAAVIARQLAQQAPEKVAAITGQRDWISDGTALIGVDNGVALLRQVSGAGCMLSGLCAAFSAITGDRLAAALSGVVVFGVAAELAASRSVGPGSLRLHLFDALYNLTAAQLIERARIVVA